MPWTGIVLAVAVSLDSFGVGVAYAVRRIRLPVLSVLVIGLCTAAFMSVSMYAGHRIAADLSAQAAPLLGGLILVAIGTWQLLRGWQQYVIQMDDDGPLLELDLRPLGIIIQILRNPVQADVNRSGQIDLKESLLLGTALGMDAFAAGFGAAMAGFTWSVVPLVGLACIAFIVLGQLMGESYLQQAFGRRAHVVPGCLLISLGILQLV